MSKPQMVRKDWADREIAGGRAMTKRQAEGVQRALQRLQRAIERGETERVLRERLGQRLSWGQVGVPEDGALLVAARAEGEAAEREAA
jgi:hypothetical protein